MNEIKKSHKVGGFSGMPFEKVRYFKSPLKSETSTPQEIIETVQSILDSVKEDGDVALTRFSKQFDKFDITAFEVTNKERLAALANLDSQTQEDSEFAIEAVKNFAKAQYSTISALEYEPSPGVNLGHRVIPIEKVGCYVPGGRYPILSAPIMTIVPAKVVGCALTVACLPPTVPDEMIAICHLAGADRIFRVGGAQAIAAMAYGTKTIPAVDKIVGPGNAYVNEAKRQVFGPVGIDQLAGPSEIFIIADKTANPTLLAIDILAQAEHDIRVRSGLITTSIEIAEQTLLEINRLLESLSTAEVAGKSWRDYGEVVVCEDEAAMIAYSDHVACEHLQIHTENPHDLAAKLKNYGSLFIGEEASVVFSDKCCGTNHTLPTMGAARYTGGLWVGDYVKICTHQWMDGRGVQLFAPPAMRQSITENMSCHALAAKVRLDGEV
jgi:sulfopropanediol 3-dehydrogenase